MTLVFADTLYWGAVLHPLDQYRAQVIRSREALGDVHLVTTDEVLTELLDGLATRGTRLREAAALAVRMRHLPSDSWAPPAEIES